MASQDIYLDEKSDVQRLLPLNTDPEARVPRPVTRRKSLRILSSILFVWITFFLITDYARFQFKKLYQTRTIPHPTTLVSVSDMSWPIPPDITVGACADWQGGNDLRGRHFALHEPFSAFAGFELPISSEKLFLLTRGRAAGSIKIGEGSGGDNKDVRVEVEALYREQSALESVKVCLVSRGDGENGLGIFGSQWDGHNAVRFDVSLTLPKAAKGSVLEVANFETDAPLFVHHVDDLDGTVHFDSIHLKTANMPITVDSLDATDAHIETANGAIKGDFHVTSSLKLVTSNAPIDVNVQLFNDDEGEFTNLLLRTSNSKIKAGLQFESANETGGKFKVSATTANAPLDIVVSEAPVNHVLILDAHTSLSHANVELPTTYEGTFNAASSLKRPTVIIDHSAADPEGKGRKRKVDLSVHGSTASGSVKWSDEKVWGRVNVDTSLALLTLRL